VINFAKNLHLLRVHFNETQGRLASAIDVRHTTVGNWENKKGEPTVSQIVGICQFFDCTLEELILSDLDDGKVLAEIAKRREGANGKVIGQPTGKAIPNKTAMYAIGAGADKVQPPGVDNLQWLILQELRNNSEKLDQLRVLVDTNKKK
jgi:DNA-binding XRE family transcriptional regulator